jgi:hypothetical protein
VTDDEISQTAQGDSSDEAMAQCPHMLQDLLMDLYDDELLNTSYKTLCDGESLLEKARRSPDLSDLREQGEKRIRVGIAHLARELEERRADSSELEWRSFVQLCMLHPIRKLLHQDPFTRRGFEKPRGHAGDPELLDMIYAVEDGHGPPEDATELGKIIFSQTTTAPACDGVRSRAKLVASAVDELALTVEKPHVLSVAAGHLREAALCGALKQRKLGRWLAFDWDIDSLDMVESRYGKFGIQTEIGTVRQLFAPREELGSFDYIFSSALYDYLQQQLARKLTEALFTMLRPRGQLLVSSFLPTTPERGYIESFMDWQLQYRSQPLMLDLVMGIDQRKVRDIRLQVQDRENVVFLHVTKN